MTTAIGPDDTDALRTGEESWPVGLSGVTESIVATRGENGRWNFAALGLHDERPVRARTWGWTRTRRNFERVNGSDPGDQHAVLVQFTSDPVAFVRAALDLWEREDPVMPSSDAWVTVGLDRSGTGQEGETEWADWQLRPGHWAVRNERVPTINRGFAAVVEASVAASRLGVASYDESMLRDRIQRLGDVARRCGGEREHEAIELLESLREE